MSILFLIYLFVAQLVAICAWNTAADTGKKELERGVMPKWLLLSEVAFCGLIWPITAPIIFSSMLSKQSAQEDKYK